jgi:hypothetical protein
MKLVTRKNLTFVVVMVEAILFLLGLVTLGDILPIPAHVLEPIGIVLAVLYLPAIFIIPKEGGSQQ